MNTSQESLHLVCGNRNYSSWSLRAWLCLRRAGVNPRVTVLPMDTDEFAARIGAYSPTRRVPVLWIGDEFIWDSLAIAETVNERYADGVLWPRDRTLRARGRAMAAEMHSGFPALRHHLPMNCRARQRTIQIDDPTQQDVLRICELWSDARSASHSKAWLLGEWSLVDAMFAPVALRFQGYKLDLPADARDYVEHWLGDKHLQEWVSLAREEHWVIAHEEAGEETAEERGGDDRM